MWESYGLPCPIVFAVIPRTYGFNMGLKRFHSNPITDVGISDWSKVNGVNGVNNKTNNKTNTQLLWELYGTLRNT